MVLAIEMGVVFVLLTAILIALYVAWQNAKFIGDRLKKKQVMKRLMAGGAAIVLAVAVAIGAVVMAYAATSDTDTKQTGQAEAAADTKTKRLKTSMCGIGSARSIIHHTIGIKMQQKIF